MKKKSSKTTQELYRQDRRGTLLLGTYRMGTHFLQHLCAYQAQAAGVIAVEHEELEKNPEGQAFSPASWLPRYLAQLVQSPGYHVVIVNHQDHKSALLDRSDILQDWHVVRVIEQDKTRWFKSFFFFLHSPAGVTATTGSIYKELEPRSVMNARLDGREALFLGDSEQGHFFHPITRLYLTSWSRKRGNYEDPALVGQLITRFQWGHHDTPEDYYQKILDNLAGPLKLAPILPVLSEAMINDLYTHMIPADLEIWFQSLRFMQNDQVMWRPNRYPDFDITEIFENGHLLQGILDRWSQSWPPASNKDTA